jgi:hypothetical protein
MGQVCSTCTAPPSASDTAANAPMGMTCVTYHRMVMSFPLSSFTIPLWTNTEEMNHDAASLLRGVCAVCVRCVCGWLHACVGRVEERGKIRDVAGRGRARGGKRRW